MKSKLRRIGFGVAALAMLLFASPRFLRADEVSNGNTASPPASNGIEGTVHGPSGAPVAGVDITIRNLESDATWRATTDAAGCYNVRNLIPGAYEISALKYGLKGARARVILDAGRLDAGRQFTADLKMTLAEVDGADVEHSSDSDRIKALEESIEELKAELRARPLFASVTGNPSPPGLPIANSRLDHSGSVASAEPQAEEEPKNSRPVTEVQASAAAPVLAQQNAGGVVPEALQAPDSPPPVDLETPFAFGDFTWLNGQPRNKDTVLDTKFFTPEVRFDTNFIEDFNQPVDHTMGGTTESFRSGEVQVEQASVGGDFHWQNVRGRILTMFGLFASTTARNDASTAVGQWDLRTAYRYVSEAWGGYHFDINHGLNVDAGIFVSYVGLFSYYNFDNWTYQPSYVSSNTPWFFNGVRVQWFPTNKLKIEPWIINGWQSYARFNGHLGLGGQILWQPKEWFKLVLNNYGNGTDSLGIPGRSRLHTDNSALVRYYNNPTNTGISKMAFSLTGDAGCEYGAGVTCHGGKAGPKQSFLGWMAYNRIWWDKDIFALTVGGGMMNNPGRFLTLLPPINGADAISGSPYFTLNPGDKAHMWDTTATFNWMPKQYITWWIEGGYRHSDVPYWSGRGGITPPGGNNGAPGYFVCNSGASAGTADLGSAYQACGVGNVWFPDLRKAEATLSAGVMVKF